MKSTTGGQHSFAKTPRADIPRSAFNRSCGVKTTFDAGYLIPLFVEEALPGDTMSLSMTMFARMGPSLKIPLDNMWISSFFFSVPNRLLWEHWEEFNGATIPDPDSTTDYEVPKVTVTCSDETVGDYMGLPVDLECIVNALPGRAYRLIWNDWFRDENLQDSENVVLTDAGGSTPYQSAPLKRGKRHDYFTSALPWPQKGPSVELPLGTTAPVITDNQQIYLSGQGATNEAIQVAGTTTNALGIGNATTDGSVVFGTTGTGLQTDLSAATAATVNQLREAFQVQKLYERDARGGSRYTEIIRSHFGVVSPDARLQRPEFLGGGKSMVGFSTVPITSDSGGTEGGDLTGYAIASGTHGFTKSFVEHCTVIGMVCLHADLNYQEGLDRMWSRTTRWDYYWPALSHIGEQAILNQELVYQDVPGVGATDDQGVWGYQERYAEYRYKPSKITGKFRSQYVSSLDIWHLAQDFAGTLPALDADFIEEDPPVARILTVPTEPAVLFDGYFKFKHVRPMPTYGVPGLIDHF